MLRYFPYLIQETGYVPCTKENALTLPGKIYTQPITCMHATYAWKKIHKYMQNLDMTDTIFHLLVSCRNVYMFPCAGACTVCICMCKYINVSAKAQLQLCACILDRHVAGEPDWSRPTVSYFVAFQTVETKKPPVSHFHVNENSNLTSVKQSVCQL